MRIAQIAGLQVAVPPKAYGGTERVIHTLTEGLARLGHEVTLFATGDSVTSAQLVPMRSRAANFDPAVNITALHVAELAEVYSQADRFDIIHSHLEHLTPPFAEATRTPTVLTLHGRLDDPRSAAAFRSSANCHYVAISQSQRRSLPTLDWAATIYHGVDVDTFPFYPTPGHYLAFVGRIAPEKRPDRAIEIAVRAGVPLKIAAKVDPSDMDYFHTVIEPLLAHPLVEFLGEVDEAGKRDLMGNALALLLPIDWPEPFGMVFIESLACGTPVLTCPVGSVPELLRDGVTGYARDTVDGCVAAVKALPAISRAGCRAYVKARFDMRSMALAYVNVYAQAQGRRRLFSVPSLATPEQARTGEGSATVDWRDLAPARYMSDPARELRDPFDDDELVTPAGR